MSNDIETKNTVVMVFTTGGHTFTGDERERTAEEIADLRELARNVDDRDLLILVVAGQEVYISTRSIEALSIVVAGA